MMTYDDSIAIRKWYDKEGIYLEPFKLTYTMAGKTATDALAGEELLISNYPCVDEEETEEDDW